MIDQNSGYCFGVEFAIQMAEDEMQEGSLYCLGDIVHNSMEVKRLNDKGLKIIDREELKTIRDSKVLIRAHGEPPETYQLALENNIELVDASCPVVLKLQNRVKLAYDKMTKANGQIVIYGNVPIQSQKLVIVVYRNFFKYSENFDGIFREFVERNPNSRTLYMYFFEGGEVFQK